MDCVTPVIVDLWNISSICSPYISLQSTTWELHQIPGLFIMCQTFSSMLQLWHNSTVSWISPTKQYTAQFDIFLWCAKLSLKHFLYPSVNFVTGSLRIWFHTLVHNPSSNLYTIQDIPVTWLSLHPCQEMHHGQFPLSVVELFWVTVRPRGKTLQYSWADPQLHSCDLTQCLPHGKHDQTEVERKEQSCLRYSLPHIDRGENCACV